MDPERSRPWPASWPPGGTDTLIEALAEDHGIAVDRPDLPGMLHDPRLGRTAVVSSFGADSVALLHFVTRIFPDLPVLFLDTGKHFAETLDYVDTVAALLGLHVVRIPPVPETLAENDPFGAQWATNPDFCCQFKRPPAMPCP